jgi:cytochrome c553
MRAALAPLLLLGGSAVAATLLGADPPPAQVESGRAVAAGAGVGQQNACFQCHGFDGVAQAAAGFPALGGQHAEYLRAQLDAYADGRRPHPVMSPIAMALNEDQRRDVAVFYATRPPPPRDARGRGDPALLQHGGVLVALGEAGRGLQACQNCHGPAGAGIDPLYPRLAGQPAIYIAARLRGWRDAEGARDVSSQNVMAGIARRMADRDIDAVAQYFAALGGAP